MTIEAVAILSHWIGPNIIALLSLFIASASFVVAGVSLWYSVFRKCIIEVYLGDKMGIVISYGMENTKIHLNCCFVNDSAKNGVIEKIGVQLNCPNNVTHLLEWNEFFKPVKNIGVDADSLPLPIPVGSNSSINKGIQFQLRTYIGRKGRTLTPSCDIDWIEGKYEIKVLGWYNTANIKDKPNLKKNITFVLTAEDAAAIFLHTASQQAQIRYIDITNKK